MLRLQAATWVGLASLIVSCGAPSNDATGTRTEAVIGGSGAVNVLVANTVVNKYYYALTADAPAGSVTLSLSGSTGIAAGDLVMIVQMQGATIDTTDTAAYGTVSALGGAGSYELVSVTSVNSTANSITVDDSCGGLKHGYAAAGQTQVIFVPQYSTLTVANGASITAPAWNGATGGVIALTASTTITLNGTGTINANAIGFRGGVMDTNATTQVDSGGHSQWVGTNTVFGAEKGEGIAGFGAQLGAAGFLGRGAPANGGGGGDNHNGGGGGGANGGVTSGSGTWTGVGTMNSGVGGATAWTLDPDYVANGNALTTSPGGGRGGYTYSANKLSPTTNGPGVAGWGGDTRYDHGGLGGRPLTSDPASAIFLGGGGGAGDSNNGTGGAGGIGGGIVFVFAGTSVSATGTGAISANGGAGNNTSGTGNDAPGGGGAGGSIVVAAPAISGLTFTANGGAGGLQNITGHGNEAEGPGGGGGGGFIALATGTNTSTVSGGAAGTTNSPGVTPFTVNGATDGTAGTVRVAAFTAPLCQPSLSVTITNTSPAIPGDPITYTITVVNDSATAGSLATNVTDTLPALTGVTWSCAASLGSSCTPTSGTGAISDTTSIAQGGTLTYTVTGTIAPTATDPFTLTATATAGALSSTATDTVPLTPSSDLSVAVTATPEPDAVDDTLTYSVKVTNSGPSTAPSGSVVITLDANETLKTATGSGWTCTGTTTVTCTNPTVAVGTSTISVAVTPTVVGSVTLGAVVSSSATDATPGNNTTSHTTTIVRCLVNSDCPTPATCNTTTDTCTLAPPVITAPADNSQTTDTTPTISGTCAAGATVLVSIDGGAPIAATVVGTTFSVTVPASLAAGPHTAVATETLGAGATAVSATSNTDHFTIVACIVNGDCPMATAPLCSPANVCVGCNGDAGSGATEACPTTAPYCALTGACGKCTTSLDCVGHPGGLICNTSTGACGTTCNVDADCNDNTKWCSAGVCTPKGTNGTPLPTVSPINGTCTTANGTRVCLSGVCDVTNNQCGLTNSKSCGPPTTSGECDSNICYASDNLCGEPNGQACTSAVVCRSGICFAADSLCGEPNGQPCATNDVCRTLCLGADETCGLLNGSPCSSATNCRSNVCNADGHCGDPAGSACTTATTCRSAACHAGSCVGSCATDADCAAADWCNANSSGCTPDLPNGQSCTRAAQCLSNVCNADGKCGDPDGAICVNATTCRSGACNGGLCGSGCTSDAQCASGTYCATTCKPTLVNGLTCARAAMCASNVCNADGKCGNPSGQPCSGADVCRSGACDATGTCAAGCTLDVQCAVASYCDLTASVCKPGLVNSVGCVRGAQCLSGVCDTDGKCGEPDGEPCGSALLCRSNMCATTGVCSGVIVPLDMTIVAGDGGATDLGAGGGDDLGAGVDGFGGFGGFGADLSVAGSRPAFSGGGFCAYAAPPDPHSGGWLGLLLVVALSALAARRRHKEIG